MPQHPDSPTPSAALRGRKIVLINHGDTLGEAATASFMLMQSLRREGVDARMVVYTQSSHEANVSNASTRISRGICYCIERLRVMMHCGFSGSNIDAVSAGSPAIDIHSHPWVREADIVCLNWICRGLVSLNGIRRLHESGKKIIWIMHDMWPFTGICHKARHCDYFTDACGNCMYLKGGGYPNDISHRMWEKKMRLYADVPILFVADSKWLELKARSSSLLRNRPVMTVPCPLPVDSHYITPPRHIDTLLTVTKPKLILIGATQLDDPSKGLDYAIDALNYIFDNHPALATKTAVYLFGDMTNPECLDRLRLSYRWLGRVNDRKILRYLYSSAKVILSTSIHEQLSDTIIEAMASGAIPVVFGDNTRAGLVNHMSNGYVARIKDSDDLAQGLLWALEADIPREEQHRYVKDIFSSDVVARKYIDLFSRII